MDVQRGSLILASTSPYRRELLARLGLPFTCEDPGVDETALTGETPAATAPRLALAKAAAVSARFPQSTVIGSDQVADLDGKPLGKPGTPEIAARQLARLSGRSAFFHTAVAVCVPDGSAGTVVTVPVRVRFRVLSPIDIDRYLAYDRPWDCAGSAKVESLGIALLDSVHSDDPTALIGLPLIATCRLLRAAGIEPLAGRS